MPVQQWEAPRRIATTPAHEGPVWFSDENALYLTTVARGGRGDAPAVDGGLLVCEQGGRQSRARISRLDRRTGRRETVCDSADGAPLTSPNDYPIPRAAILGGYRAVVIWCARFHVAFGAAPLTTTEDT